METSVFDRIERARESWNVLRHPFYERWSEGDLRPEELAFYAGQYRHAVGAIATMSESVAAAFPARKDLAAHAVAEREHVALWDSFTEAAGGEVDTAPTPETAACVAEWTGGDALETLARLYAIESGQPAIARTKLDGLREHYGFADGDSTAYFSVHETLDHQHAAEGRELLDALSPAERDDTLVAAAEGALRANWRLLDGV